ncbi:MAG: DsbA family protein [Acidobacteriota bacterium]|nr:DsbA family protein [Acidobacteriota bacterium]
MPNLSPLAGVGAVLLALLAGAHAQAQDEVVATIGDQQIRREELEKEAELALEEAEMARIRCEIEADRSGHEVLETSLQQLVRRRLLDLEAANDGVAADEVEARMREAAEAVDQAAVDAFYEQNKERIGQPKEAVEEQIRQFLQQQRIQSAQETLFLGLEARYGVNYRLDPLRFDVGADGFASFGPVDAPITIVEFSDFECPYCSRLLPTLEQAKSQYGDKLRVVYRHFPLSIHPNAQKAAEASLCAHDQGRFWEMHDLLFAEQGSLAPADLKEKAGRLGLDATAFDECLDSDRYFDSVQTDMRAGASVGVDGTPAMFVNGRFLSGAVGFEALAEIVDDELARRK